MKRILFLFVILCFVVLVYGCKTFDAITAAGANVAAATGVISSGQASSIKKTSSAVGKTFEAITPEQEYYIGRAVAASILKSYKPYDNSTANRYLNLLGQTLAASSDKPETFGGYHFMIMDTDEINAFSAPGGFILISRGLLRCCPNEDSVAAVLAHEVAHVQHEHGLRAIKKSRLTSALTVLAAESAKNLGGQQLAELTGAFEGSISDITGTMVNSGYARKFERQADETAVEIMKRVGYNPMGLKIMLFEMGKQMQNQESGFAKTHPDPKDRIADVDKLLDNVNKIAQPSSRKTRFKAALAGI